jgi:hypothetical protein
MHSRCRLTIFPSLALLLLASAPLTAQRSAATRQRMNSLTRALLHDQELREFFPARGVWTWRQTFHGENETHGEWRFTAADVQPASEYCGPLWGTLGHSIHAMRVSSLVFQAFEGRWSVSGPRRYSSTARARDQVIGRADVEWRLEDGRWVISEIEQHDYAEPPRPPDSLALAMERDRGRSPEASDVTADTTQWFRDNEPISVDRHRYSKYGLPRSLERHEIQQYGWVDSIRVYTEAGSSCPTVVYVPVGPFEYQPYQTEALECCS